MSDRKSILKREILKSLRSISILIIVLIILYNGLSLTQLLKLDLNDRLVWTIDFGIYSALLSILYSGVHYCFIRLKLNIEVLMVSKQEGLNKITLRDNSPQKIVLNLIIEGKEKLIPSELKIVFPYWLDIQPRPKPYLTESIDSNIIFIDINYLIKGKENIKLKESITIDVIRITSEENDESVEASLKVGLIKKIFSINFSSKCIDIHIDKE